MHELSLPEPMLSLSMLISANNVPGQHSARGGAISHLATSSARGVDSAFLDKRSGGDMAQGGPKTAKDDPPDGGSTETTGHEGPVVSVGVPKLEAIDHPGSQFSGQ